MLTTPFPTLLLSPPTLPHFFPFYILLTYWLFYYLSTNLTIHSTTIYSDYTLLLYHKVCSRDRANPRGAGVRRIHTYTSHLSHRTLSIHSVHIILYTRI